MPIGLLARRLHAGLALLAAGLVLAYVIAPLRGVGVAAMIVLVPHLAYSLLQLGRRRDNAGQIARLGNWAYSLGRWSALPVTGFLLYAWRVGIGAPLLDVPGWAVFAAGALACALYLGWSTFSAWIDLVGLARRPAARLALLHAALLVGSAAFASWQIWSRGG